MTNFQQIEKSYLTILVFSLLQLLFWLVVWNMFYFSIYWEQSSQLTFIFLRGVEATNRYDYVSLSLHTSKLERLDKASKATSTRRRPTFLFWEDQQETWEYRYDIYIYIIHIFICIHSTSTVYGYKLIYCIYMYTYIYMYI